jgi:hypothetical protein
LPTIAQQRQADSNPSQPHHHVIDSFLNQYPKENLKNSQQKGDARFTYHVQFSQKSRPSKCHVYQLRIHKQITISINRHGTTHVAPFPKEKIGGIHKGTSLTLLKIKTSFMGAKQARFGKPAPFLEKISTNSCPAFEIEWEGDVKQNSE